MNICNKIESLQYNAALAILLGLLEGHQKKNFTWNWALNFRVQEDG